MIVVINTMSSPSVQKTFEDYVDGKRGFFKIDGGDGSYKVHVVEPDGHLKWVFTMFKGNLSVTHKKGVHTFPCEEGWDNAFYNMKLLCAKQKLACLQDPKAICKQKKVIRCISEEKMQAQVERIKKMMQAQAK
jgi:hypothetical protein